MSGEDDHYEDFDAPPPPPPSGEFPAHDYQMQGQQYYDQQQYPGQYQEDYGYDNVVEQQFNGKCLIIQLLEVLR